MTLYEIYNKIDSKRYVGISSNIGRRWREHRAELRSNRHHNSHFQAAWNKYGENNFNFNIINKFNNLDELNKAEKEYIQENNLLDSKFGYNVAVGGNSFKHSLDSKEKISQSNEVSVISKCLKTGKEKVYSRILDVEKDGFNPKSIANACVLREYKTKDRKFTIKTHKKYVWMYLEDYKNNPKELERRFKEYKNTKARPSRYNKVYGMSIKSGGTIEYEAVYHVKKDGFSHSTVSKCCKNPEVSKSHKGYVWSFDKDNLKDKRLIALNKKTHKVRV